MVDDDADVVEVEIAAVEAEGDAEDIAVEAEVDVEGEVVEGEAADS